MNFDQPFQIHDNMEVVKRMGMAFGLETNTCSQKNLDIFRTMVSKELHPYLEGEGNISQTQCLLNIGDFGPEITTTAAREEGRGGARSP